LFGCWVGDEIGDCGGWFVKDAVNCGRECHGGG
jgi:hypothetical protein